MINKLRNCEEIILTQWCSRSQWAALRNAKLQQKDNGIGSLQCSKYMLLQISNVEQKMTSKLAAKWVFIPLSTPYQDWLVVEE